MSKQLFFGLADERAPGIPQGNYLILNMIHGLPRVELRHGGTAIKIKRAIIDQMMITMI